MGRRINIMIDEDTWRILARIPVATRNRAINDALRVWVVRHRRSDAVHELDALCARLPVASATEAAQWIRDDREQGQ